MDAPEEDFDIKLQKISGDLISDFDRSFLLFLRKSDGAGGGAVRSRVRTRDTARMCSLLDPFQEMPQLLDPHLPRWIPALAEAFLESLQVRRRPRALSARSSWVWPLQTAACKLLYTFCKIRGEKVIVRFLNVEAKYLELLLAALDESESGRPAAPSPELASPGWTWEERYIVLLWLSQLFLAPFDLSTISSRDVEGDDLPAIPGLDWSPNVPGITVRVLPLAMKYLSCPGKERDAAKTLLVRVAMRTDMQELGVLHALVQWALYSLRPRKDELVENPYHHIGVLSFLAGILNSSSETSDMDKYLSPIFYATHAIATEENPTFEAIVSSAVARKMMIKVIRSLATQILRRGNQDMAATELVETSIGYLLERLADNDTPVRFAASKALGVITLKLDAEMASQVIDAVLESLNRNVLWVKNASDPTMPSTRDLTSADPLEWHGLMLTLSHLLYRRSPPAGNLPDIVHALLLGLSFDRRSASGGSTGTNVRDAACFGIWALARRYTTAELLAVPTKSISVAASHSSGASILQILGTELVVTATLDPAGNIRRGSSAALQELIGRHPDTVEQGIWVVQTVDYHAVALRSRAVTEVAMNAARLSSQYGEAILEALLGWRGIGDADATARRAAAKAYGAIMAALATSGPADPLSRFADTAETILRRLRALQPRQVDEKHGILLSYAATFDSFPSLVSAAASGGNPQPPANTARMLQRAITALRTVLDECREAAIRRPELIAEAASRLIISSFPVAQAAVLGPSNLDSLLPGPDLVSGVGSQTLSDIVSAVDEKDEEAPEPLRNLFAVIQVTLNEWLSRPEQEVIAAASEAAPVLLVFSEQEDRGGSKSRENLIRAWAARVRNPPASREGSGFGFFFALTMAYPFLSHIKGGKEEDNALICRAILGRWTKETKIEARVSLLQALTKSDVLEQNFQQFLGLISEGLDDYTTNARGDVGSHVRLQAIKATRSLWASIGDATSSQESVQVMVSQLFLRILRLAAEKLDRVRVEAQSTLALALQTSYASRFTKSTFSSRPYFRYLLNLQTAGHLHPSISETAKSEPERWMDELMAGFVTSADTGNEDLVIASRAALTDYCEKSQENLERVCQALTRNLKSRQGQDRVVVPTLEIISFLFYVGVFPRCGQVDYKNLCLLVQKSGYRTGNVRKLEACVKVYGAIAGLEDQAARSEPAANTKRLEGINESRRRLGALMHHPWPRIRSAVVDELWGLLSMQDVESAEKLKGTDWGKAEKASIQGLVEELSRP